MKTDLRIIKTKNALYYALIDLLKEKTFEEIKVSNICEKAYVNRSTFYAHYKDKYELFVDLINSLKDSFKKELKSIEEDDLKDYYLKMIKVFLNHIEGKEDIYKSILVNNRSSIIIDMIYDTVKEDINERANNNDKGVPNDVFTSYYLGGVVNIVIEWFKNNKKYTKEQMIEYLDKLMI